MRFFGRGGKKDKKQPLIQEVHSLGKDDAGKDNNNLPTPLPVPGVLGVNEATQDVINEALTQDGSDDLAIDMNIPPRRVTTGEQNMILPKHMQKALDKRRDDEILILDEDEIIATGDNGATSYVPIEEIRTQSFPSPNVDSREIADDDDEETEVVSAISLSTIGASIEREMEAARSMRDKPPLEIRAKKQKTKRKEEITVLGLIKKKMPIWIVDTLADGYDKLHSIVPKKQEKSLEEVPVTARRYRRDHPDLLLPGNVPRVGFSACFAAIPVWVKFLAVGAVAASMAATVAYQLQDTLLGEEFFDRYEEKFVDWTEEKRVAFIGNSYLFVNDVPRLMEAISHNRIHQDSCLNPSASLGKLLRAGNGMYEVWQTENALTYKYNTDWVEDEDEAQAYDFGQCTPFQLLHGYDNDISYMNYNNAYYYEEGMNPCFEDEKYMFYLYERNLKNPPVFDYVVLTDQTKRMANVDAREDTVEALKYAYAPMIKDSRAVPLVVDTHAYPGEWGSNITMDGDSIPYTQAMIYYAVQEYLMALKYNLPSYQQPRVVPIGMAYLVVWDEDHALWSKLFLNETAAPYASPHGSYLFANVLYAVMYGHLPRRPESQTEIKKFFMTARYVPEIPDDWSDLYPTVEESDYLRLTARRVALQGYVPSVFTEAHEEIENEIRTDMTPECICEEREEGASGDEGEEGASQEEAGEDEQAEEEEYGEYDGDECVCEGEDAWEDEEAEREEGDEDVDMNEDAYRRRWFL